ncbi:MAG: chromate efflux transporter [Bacteroidota bacterium]|jgi:chromate transporter
MEHSKIKKFRNILFLINVLKLALTAFGGPQIHLVMFQKLLVNKKKFITDDDLKELNSLCSMLPGPTSTQTITAIGFKIGGPTLAFFTLAIWVLPACLIMTFFAIIIHWYNIDNPKLDFLKYMQPMAVGFIIYAAYQIIQMFISKTFHWILLLLSAIVAIIFQTPYLFPILLLIGGFISNQINKEKGVKVKPIKNINWSNFILFLGILLFAAILGAFTQNKFSLLFENTYRYGSIVFGGGFVLIPLMFNQFVEIKQYLTANEFLAGVGLVQAMPGPVFSIATYCNAMALKEFGLGGQLIGAIIGTIAIFLPGALLIFFVYPIWNKIKNFTPIKNAIEGINAASAGLVIASAYLLFKPVVLNQPNMIVLLLTLFLLLTTRVPSPVIVIICILASFIY